MASSSTGSSGRRRRRSSSQSPEKPKKNDFLIAVCFVTMLALAVVLFFKVTEDKALPTGASEAEAPVPTSTPVASPAGSPTPPQDLQLSFEQYGDKLQSLQDDNTRQSDFIQQTAGSRVRWRAKVVSVDDSPGGRSVVLGSASPTGGSYRMQVKFEHPTQTVVNCLLQLRTFDVVRVTGTLTPQNSHGISGEDIVLSP